MKKCPRCAEEIQDEAIKCKHCKSDLTVQHESNRPPWWAWVLGIAGLSMLIFTLGKDWQSKNEQETFVKTELAAKFNDLAQSLKAIDTGNSAAVKINPVEYSDYRLVYRTKSELASAAKTSASNITIGEIIRTIEANDNAVSMSKTAKGINLDIISSEAVPITVEYSCDDLKKSCIAQGGNMNGQILSSEEAESMSALFAGMTKLNQ